MTTTAHNARDLTGQRFGKLTALATVGRDKNRKTLWECICDCGNRSVVIGAKLSNGRARSCGCEQGRRPVEPRPPKQRPAPVAPPQPMRPWLRLKAEQRVALRANIFHLLEYARVIKQTELEKVW